MPRIFSICRCDGCSSCSGAILGLFTCYAGFMACSRIDFARQQSFPGSSTSDIHCGRYDIQGDAKRTPILNRPVSGWRNLLAGPRRSHSRAAAPLLLIRHYKAPDAAQSAGKQQRYRSRNASR